MKMSRIGILSLVILSLLSTTGCVGRVMARKNIVDGANAYNNRKFEEAESLFRSAMKWDSSQKVAQLFLARTLHSQYASDRKNVAKAEEAIGVYKEVLVADPADHSSFKSVANLFETLKKDDELVAWLEQRAADEKVPKDQRAEAYTSLAARQYSCANDISDVEPVKKTVEKAGKAEFVFSKPENAADFDKLKTCTAKGTEFIDKAVALNDASDSTWSYKTSLLVQQSRIAEMEGNAADKDKFRKESDTAKARFQELAEARRKKEEEEAAKKKAEEDAKK